VSTGNKSAGVAFVDLAVGDSKALVEGIIRVAETSAQGFSSTFAKSFSGNGISKEIRDSIVLASTKAADEAVSAVNSRLKAAKVAVIDPGEAGRQGRQAGERASNELGESLRSGAKKAGQRAGEDAGNAMNRAFASTVKNIAAGVSIGNAITNSVQSTLGFIKGATFDFNNQLTTANIAFSTMLGNGQKATAFIANLKDFAKNTPFQFEDLVDASQRLLAMGIAAQDILPDLTAIGDAVANLGGGKEKIDRIVLALGQMQAAGHVTGMELRQLTEAGVPALRILADSYGVTTAEMTKMISAGSVDSDRGIKAIVDGLEHGTKSVASFGGAMEKQSHTMQGALSNIKDSLTIALADTAKPMFDDAAKGAEGFVHWLSSPQFAVFARQMQIGANAVGAVVGPLAGMATGLVSVIGPMGTLVVLAEALFARKIASGMGSFSTGIATARTEMAKAALTGGDLNAVQRKLNSEVGSFAGTLGGLSSRVQVATTTQGSLAGGLAAVKGSASTGEGWA
jgi:tape measure domain-containing protein